MPAQEAKWARGNRLGAVDDKDWMAMIGRGNTVANPDVISIAGRAIGTVVRGTDEQINSSQSEDSYIQKLEC